MRKSIGTFTTWLFFRAPRPQMLGDAHMTWQQTQLEKQVKARGQRVLRRWRTLFKGVLLGAQLLEEYGSHD